MTRRSPALASPFRRARTQRGLRVVVDLLYFTGRRGGTETYARELLPALAEVAPDLSFVGLVNRETSRPPLDWFPGRLVRLPVPGGNQIGWALGEVTLVGPVARALGADLLYCPANFGPLTRFLPTVVTVHDALGHRHPELIGRLGRGVSALSGRAARAATRVLTVSRASADDLVRFVGVAGDRVDVVPNAAARPSAAGRCPLPDGVDRARPLVLTTGNRLPHKNFPLLLEAWARMEPEQRPVLAVTGSHGEDPLRPLVRQHGLDDDVILLGWVETRALEALYAAADLYVCPSLFEGFGLPVLEAMQRGVPVLASDIGALREVGGEAARYVGEPSAAAWSGAVRELLAAPSTLAGMRDQGLARAAEFSWEAAATATARTLRLAAGGEAAA